MRLWKLWKQRKEQKQIVEDTESALSNEAYREDGIFYFDREHHKPIIRSSICTGEQVAGFKDLRTNRFTEIMLVRNNEDIEEFIQKYGISREEIRREW